MTPFIVRRGEFGDSEQMTATFVELSPRDYTSGATWQYIVGVSPYAAPIIQGAMPSPTQVNVANGDGTSTVTLTFDYTFVSGDLSSAGYYESWIKGLANDGSWEKVFSEPPLEEVAAP